MQALYIMAKGHLVCLVHGCTPAFDRARVAENKCLIKIWLISGILIPFYYRYWSHLCQNVSKKWSRLKESPGPSPRWGCTAVPFPDEQRHKGPLVLQPSLRKHRWKGPSHKQGAPCPPVVVTILKHYSSSDNRKMQIHTLFCFWLREACVYLVL